MEKNKKMKVPKQDDNYTHNIHRDNERTLDRRGFMKTMVGAAGVFAVASLPWGTLAARELLGLAPKQEENIVKIADVAQVSIGEAVDFAYPSKHDPALLVRVGENEYRAYQNSCPHLKCPVFWNKEQKELLCPCHHGKFSVMTGDPIAGPPKRALPEIILKIHDGAIYATGVRPYEI
ncbi:2Fe-2S ferredoxin [Brevibacillus laterosporus]|uniref:2Fe-2S ferredoxin n=1 Tax=Brevibacillus laterosporus TaxID=1465 RepID=A0A502J5Z5_BRELA|nr:Rieske 2Fe-2S domain-containing protein [Brevibacillus laterosporus]QDX94427.1 2Fe-2S ferredoxin [Brevibacillus laterosporus]RAP31024.1 Ubiquinol-cytochrome C reductase iron-sulfur subunit [Brevibacillus laterosporus]TPG68320.1 2Fe-2S ferredoxin [Brevibacillus laterosporus]TPG92996.1 2Fe-2S ferredoxin [Brevibacillus laterosporus]